MCPTFQPVITCNNRSASTGLEAEAGPNVALVSYFRSKVAKFTIDFYYWSHEQNVTPSFVTWTSKVFVGLNHDLFVENQNLQTVVPLTCLSRCPCRCCSHPTCITLHSLLSSTKDVEQNTTIVSCHGIQAEQHFVIMFQCHTFWRPHPVIPRRVMPESPKRVKTTHTASLTQCVTI